jgi:hypothetical protein
MFALVLDIVVADPSPRIAVELTVNRPPIVVGAP